MSWAIAVTRGFLLCGTSLRQHMAGSPSRLEHLLHAVWSLWPSPGHDMSSANNVSRQVTLWSHNALPGTDRLLTTYC